MDEAAAKQWLAAQDVPRGTIDRLIAFVELLTTEAGKQNLLSRSTHHQMWARHIVDSAQLTKLGVGSSSGTWIDLGSGAGFPGLVIAMLVDVQIVLVESRRLRAEWLLRAIEYFELNNATVQHLRVEDVEISDVAVITARAFAPLPKLLAVAHRLATPETLWLLPKGRGAAEELASVAATWHGDFTMVPSVTDPASAIIVARKVRPRIGRR